MYLYTFSEFNESKINGTTMECISNVNMWLFWSECSENLKMLHKCQVFTQCSFNTGKKLATGY